MLKFLLSFSKKSLIPVLIILPISVALSLFLVEKIVGFSLPQLTHNQAKQVSLRVSHKSDFLPSDLKPNQQTTHIGNTYEFSYPVRINSLGYRMQEFSLEKPQDEFRILMLGDSLTFGYGVEEKDNIPSLVEKKLNDYLAKNSINRKILIINAGFADGKSPDAYYLYLKKIGLDLNPDLIIVNYFLNNDISDLDDTVWEKVDQYGLPEKISSKTTEVEEDYTKLKRPYQNWKLTIPVFRNSHLWVLFATSLESKSPGTVSKVKKLLGIEDKLPLVTDRENENCLFVDECSPKMHELFDRYLRLIQATAGLARSHNVPIIVSLLPANPQVGQIAQSQSEKPQQQPQSEDFEPQKRIKQYLLENQIEYIDPLSYVVDSNWSRYYYPKDGHPTVAGYAKLSQGYFDFLTEKWSIIDKIKQ